DQFLMFSAPGGGNMAVFTGGCGSEVQNRCIAVGRQPAPTPFLARAGVPYLILIEFGPDTPAYDATLDLTVQSGGPPAPPPVNDNCAQAIVVPSLPFQDSRLPENASSDVDSACNDSTSPVTAHGVWYTYTPSAPGEVGIRQLNTNQHITLSVF